LGPRLEQNGGDDHDQGRQDRPADEYRTA
jgi:hypothetical protein